jgi:hypothetical protein
LEKNRRDQKKILRDIPTQKEERIAPKRGLFIRFQLSHFLRNNKQWSTRLAKRPRPYNQQPPTEERSSELLGKRKEKS